MKKKKTYKSFTFTWYIIDCLMTVLFYVFCCRLCRSIWLPARQRVKLNKYIHACMHAHSQKFYCIRWEIENLKYFYNFLTIDYMIQNVVVCVLFSVLSSLPNSLFFTAHLKYIFYTAFSALILALSLSHSLTLCLMFCSPSLYLLLSLYEVTRNNTGECICI